MTYDEYVNKRDELIAQAEAMVNEGNASEAKAISETVEALDAEYQELKDTRETVAALQNSAVPAPELVQENEKIEVNEIMENKIDYEVAFAKVLMGQKLNAAEQEVFDVYNAAPANNAEDHKILIPTTTQDKIWQEIADQHPIIGDVAMTNVKGNLELIKETSVGDAAEWVDEATAATDQTTAFAKLTLTGNELVKSIPVSWKLKAMSIDAFLGYITSKIAERMSAAIATAVVAGQGVPGTEDEFKAQPYGIVTRLMAEASTPQVITYSTSGVTYKNLTEAMAAIKSGYAAGVKIYAKSSTIWGQLANLVDGNKRPLFIPDVTGEGVGRLFGRPVVEEDAVPDGAILFGNVGAGYAMNRQGDMSIFTEDHVKARYTDYMGYAILDGDVVTTKAFAYIKSST